MRDKILITGGTGKTGSRLARILRDRDVQPRIASRSSRGEEHDGEVVRFDWRDGATFPAALADVHAIYLVAPTDTSEPLEVMRPFLEQAIGSGVEHFVLLSASSLEEGGPMMGKVHAYLRSEAPGWTVLRPTWFMQNFSEGPHRATICDEGVIYSATGQGRVPFIDAGDIAGVAAQALVDPLFPNRDAVLTGPQLLSYDEVALLLSQVLGREIVHRRLSEAELTRRYEQLGLPPEYAPILAAMDTAIAQGAENRVTDEVQGITGREPSSFLAFAAAAQQAWGTA
jgi:ergot alkaloid biosynthesis protein